MDNLLNIDVVFEKENYSGKKFQGKEFDGCTFKNCEFSNSILTDCVFIDCEFTDCNLSMCKLPGTSLKTVVFKECKLLGIQFNECDDFLFNISFYGCALDYSWFINKKMPKRPFVNCSLKGVNFSGSDLTSVNFERSNLENAVFEGAQLKGCDFTSAYNIKIDPEQNMMKGAKFSVDSIPGLLSKYDIRIV